MTGGEPADHSTSEARGAAPAADPQAAPSFARVFRAGAGLAEALRDSLTALVALATAEARLLRASVALVLIGAVALVAFAVSLWACVVALIGWALMVATGSVGIALGILVALHLGLVVGIWFAIRRAVHHASFPGTRDELQVLGRELRQHVQHFQRAPAPSSDPAAEP